MPAERSKLCPRRRESLAWVLLALVTAQAVPAPTSSKAFLLLLSLCPACCAMRSLVRSRETAPRPPRANSHPSCCHPSQEHGLHLSSSSWNLCLAPWPNSQGFGGPSDPGSPPGAASATSALPGPHSAPRPQSVHGRGSTITHGKVRVAQKPPRTLRR